MRKDLIFLLPSAPRRVCPLPIVTYDCITDHPLTYGHETTNIYYLTVCGSQEFQRSLVHDSGCTQHVGRD